MAEILDEKTTKQRGGKREGAGRKKTGRCRDAPHRRRPALSNRHPVHIVYRITSRCSLRRREIYAVFRRVLAQYLGLADFRIVHISIQTNHLHMLVEAADANVLTQRIKSFATRAARALNKRQGSCGPVFAYRYYASQIKTARYARHALGYVLNNWRRHRQDWEHAAARSAKLDPYSSAVSFDGWTMRFSPPKSYAPLPVSPPHTTLLREDWRLYGLIDPWEVPGPLWK